MMILIADSGSTKTDWCLSEDGRQIARLVSKGINPYFQTEEEIRQELITVLLPHLKSYIVEGIWFYGAGCAFPDKIDRVKRSLLYCFPGTPIIVGSDLFGAARGLCGDNPGIACILGTGSNSCYYDGTEIKENVSPLGFILGDEGSGAMLGKLLVGDCLKNQLPPGVKEQFLSRFNLTPAEIIDRVYRQPFPNRFLASLSPFLIGNMEQPEIYRMVYNGFISFFERNVKQYDYQNYPVHLTGSIAWYYREVVKKAAESCGIQPGKIIQSPMEGLIQYHSKERDGIY